MFRRILMAAAIALGLMAAPAMAEPLKEINFGIISTESSQNLRPKWDPFLADLEKQTGIKVNAFFAPDYAGVIEAMRFNKVQVAWFGNKSAMEAVDRAEGEVFVQTVDVEGNPGYWSVLIAHKDSPYNNFDDVLANASEVTFGNGDPNSTSGFLVPSYYLFAQNGVDPKKVFKRVLNANHESNALAVASKQVDIATNNTENLRIIENKAPEHYAQIKEIWRSPLIPSDPIVWRKDLDDETKAKIRGFFLNYGVSGDDVEHAKEVLAGLDWAPFRPSDNNQLLPIRQLELAKDRAKIEGDGKLSADEKTAKLAEIDAQLASLQEQAEKLQKAQ
ncbi:MAG: phosphonate ABC transporter substrate-binding protein [Alphaproteobacteria bacterium]